MKEILYPNLKAEMAKKGINQKDFVGIIGTAGTVQAKFNIIGRMKVRDMYSISKILNNDDLNYLFSTGIPEQYYIRSDNNVEKSKANNSK